MPELRSIELGKLLHEFLSEFSSYFQDVKCEIIECPNLLQNPFNLSIRSFGQLIYMVPDSFSKEEASNQITSGQFVCSIDNYHIVSDGKPCKMLEMKFDRQKPNSPANNWYCIMKERADKVFGSNWELLCLEFIADNKFSIFLVKNSSERKVNEVKTPSKIWVVPINRRIAASSTKKIVKRVKSKNSTITTPTNETDSTQFTASKSVETNGLTTNEMKINGISKKQNDNNAQLEIQHAKTIVKLDNANSENDSKQICPKENGLPENILPTLCNGGRTFGVVLKPVAMNGDVNKDNKSLDPLGTSLNPVSNSISSSPTEVKSNEKSISENSDDEYHSVNSSNTSSPTLFKIIPTTSDTLDRGSTISAPATNKSSLPSSLTNGSMRRQTNALSPRLLGATSVNKLSPISSCDSIPEEETDEKWQKVSVDDEETLMLLNDESSTRRSLDREEDDFSTYSIASTTSGWQDGGDRRAPAEKIQARSSLAFSELKKIPVHVRENSSNSYASSLASTLSGNDMPKNSKGPNLLGQQQNNANVLVRGMAPLPVVFLQKVLSQFSYKEIGDMRRVHPHWDEICGQFLNSAYYRLIHSAEQMLSECRRRYILEKCLEQPIHVLNNLHLHVLNPIDSMRVFIDEGIVCFPYGQIIDKAFELLSKIEKIMQTNVEDQDVIVYACENLVILSRRALGHYKKLVEPEAEKRMTEVYRLSVAHQAASQLQRIDSFLMEANVNKLERNADKAKEDLKWEIEQLKAQNHQLKKDNRELKAACSRLDQRVEILERKFKTMARLLQQTNYNMPVLVVLKEEYYN